MKIYAIYSIHMGNKEFMKNHYYVDPVKAQKTLKRLQNSLKHGKKLAIFYGMEEINVNE